MGQALLDALLAESDLALASALDVAQSPLIGHDAGERIGRMTGIAVAADVAAAVARADVLIDFTRPAGTLANVGACAPAGVAAVVGTTGLSSEDKRALVDFARSIPIVLAPNMSVGVTVLARLAEEAAKLLGEGYDVEIVEMHHRHKVDAPSGTALQLGEAAAHHLGDDPIAAGAQEAERRLHDAADLPFDVLLQHLAGPVQPLAHRRLAHPQHLRRLGGVERVDHPQHQHLAVIVR